MQIKLIGKTFICGSTLQKGAYLSLKFAGWHQGQYIRRHCDEAVKYSGRTLNLSLHLNQHHPPAKR